jgi:uroporphyrinogen decarboxylase
MKLTERIQQLPGRAAAPLVGYPTVAYTGATVRDGITNARAQTDALLAYYEAARPDVLLPFMDLSVEAEALGLPVRFKEMDSPDVTEHPVRGVDDLTALAEPNVPHGGRMPVYLDTLRELTQKTDALIGCYIASPFTLAGLLMSAEELSINTMLEPDLCHTVLDFSSRVAGDYARAQAEAGADFVVLLEPTAALMSPDLYEQFVGPYVRRMVDAVGVPIVLHVCGRTTKLIPSFLKDPVQGLSLDSDVDLPAIAAQVPEDVAIIGNIAPVAVMLNGTPEAVRAAVRELGHRMKHYPNFIPSTGCDVPPEAPKENLEAFSEAVRELEA